MGEGRGDGGSFPWNFIQRNKISLENKDVREVSVNAALRGYLPKRSVAKEHPFTFRDAAFSWSVNARAGPTVAGSLIGAVVREERFE